MQYLPLLAAEGKTHRVGGEGMRGGLLLTDPYDEVGRNTLKLVSGILRREDPAVMDDDGATVFPELREINLQENYKKLRILVLQNRDSIILQIGIPIVCLLFM